jgi:lipoprotein NlpI/transglutaminase-like putative cysteine protease
MRLANFVLAALLVAGILGSSGASAQQAAGIPLKEVQLPPNSFTLAAPVPPWVTETQIPDSAATQPIVVRLSDTQYLVDATPVVFVRRATLINDTASLAAAGRLSISFAPDYERIELHSIRVHRGQDELDRTTSSNIRFLQREQGLEQGIYSGQVTASILIDDLRVGDTIDVTYSIYGQNPVFGGKFAGRVGWDQSFPTTRRHLVLNYPANRRIAWRMIGDRNTAPVIPTETVKDGLRRLEFDERSLPEAAIEAGVPSGFFAFRFLQFSEYESWSDVANWAVKLFETKAQANGELQPIVEKIGALNSNEARVAAALEFVQSEIRYFSVSLGESSHRPAPPDVVLRRRYGDCKDKSLLLMTLLGELGISSKPVLLEVGRRIGLDETLPSAQFFNHVIVQAEVGGKTFFLDPARLGQHGPLDRMGQAHEGAQVLVVAPETTTLSVIPSRNPADLVDDEIVEQATLSKLGDDGQLRVKRTLRGLTAERLRVATELASRDQMSKRIGDAMERRYPGAKLDGEPVINDDRNQNTITLEATYRIPKLAFERDENWFIAFRPDNMTGVLPTSPSANRTMPLGIALAPYHATYSFDITLPEEVSAVSDPHAQTATDDYFSLTSSRYFRGNIARTTVELTTLRPFVDPKDYSKYADDLRSANSAIGGLFAFGKAAIKAKTPDGAPTDRFQALSQELVKKTTETIESGKLSGSDQADAYCSRASALADLGRQEEALRDANEAIRLAPSSTGVLGCRAGIYLKFGQFERSIAEYSKVISLGGIRAPAYQMRGMAKLYAGLADEAGADFAKAGELADKDMKIYSDLWLIAAYARTGKPIPDTLVKRAAAEAHGEWPRPALAMLTGAVPPEDLLKVLEEKKGDEQRMLASEAYFYLGQHDLIVGDKQSAKSHFAKARQQGVIAYDEHLAAGFELQRLNNEAVTGQAAPGVTGLAAPGLSKPAAAAQ